MTTSPRRSKGRLYQLTGQYGRLTQDDGRSKGQYTRSNGWCGGSKTKVDWCARGSKPTDEWYLSMDRLTIVKDRLKDYVDVSTCPFDLAKDWSTRRINPYTRYP